MVQHWHQLPPSERQAQRFGSRIGCGTGSCEVKIVAGGHPMSLQLMAARCHTKLLAWMRWVREERLLGWSWSWES